MTDDNAASAAVVDLVGINQTRVQAMLMGTSQGGQAPSLLLAWHQVVDSAADLWSALPPTTAPAQLLMERLTGLSTSLHDSMQRAPWPTPAQTDEQMHALTETFTQAADLLRAGRGQLSHADADQVRAAVAATMQLGAHAVRIVANHYVAEAATLTNSGRPPSPTPPQRPGRRSGGPAVRIRTDCRRRGRRPLPLTARRRSHIRRPGTRRESRRMADSIPPHPRPTPHRSQPVHDRPNPGTHRKAGRRSVPFQGRDRRRRPRRPLIPGTPVTGGRHRRLARPDRPNGIPCWPATRTNTSTPNSSVPATESEPSLISSSADRPAVPTPPTHWHSPSTSAKPAPLSRTHSPTDPPWPDQSATQQMQQDRRSADLPDTWPIGRSPWPATTSPGSTPAP